MIKLIISLFLILTFSFSSYSQQYADSVTFALLGGTNNTATNLNAVLGPPEFPIYNSNTFVALGGGFILIDLGVFLIDGAGPDMKIYEVGDSYGATTEPFSVLANSDNLQTGWQFLGTYPGDTVSIDLGNFGLNNIRYIAIFDSAANYGGLVWPGADIDGVELINFQTTTISENNKVSPNAIFLFQNYPNPFNPETTIEFAVKQFSKVELRIYNNLGQTVRTLVDDYKTTGEYSVVWDGKDDYGKAAPSGNYFYQIKMAEFTSTKKMIHIK